MKKLHQCILIGMTVVGLSATAFAADQAGCDKMGWHHGDDHGKFSEQRKARIAKHQAELHDKLKLTAAQEPAWKTFTASMMPTEGAQRADREAIAKLPAPERMEKMLGMMKERESRMASRLASLKTFYAALTPEQQKIFDANTGPHGRHHGDQH